MCADEHENAGFAGPYFTPRFRDNQQNKINFRLVLNISSEIRGLDEQL